MKNHQQWLALSALIVVFLWTPAALRGGDLDPPAGPIAPTMHTLDEIYDLAAGASSCPPCVWDVEVRASIAGPTTVVTGSGIVHSVILSSTSPGTIKDGLANELARVSGSPTQPGLNDQLNLDVRYENGLIIEPNGSGIANVAVLYKPDP